MFNFFRSKSSLPPPPVVNAETDVVSHPEKPRYQGVAQKDRWDQIEYAFTSGGVKYFKFVSEVNAPDELTVSEKIQDYFFNKGYGYAGEGQDQMAFKSPRGTIVKVLGFGNPDREQAVRDYVEFFQRNQRNPHFPRIYNAGEFTIDGETYFVYETEFLQYVGGSEETLEYLEDLMSAMGRDTVVPFMSNREKPTELSDQELDGLLNATQDIIDALVGPKGYNLDLGQIENIRRRPNGQLVLADPISVY
jgi:hypothetical protein